MTLKMPSSLEDQDTMPPEHDPALISEILHELAKTRTKQPPFASAHEGYAVVKEELDQLWEEIKRRPNHRSVVLMRREAIQLAAMTLAFIEDCCDRQGA